MITITKELFIETGHRLMNHESKCKNAHGHQYKICITCHAEKLDEVGRIVDFSVIKREVGGWLDDHWDHGMLLQRGDNLATFLKAEGNKVYVMEDPPTAENLATLVLRVARGLLRPFGVHVVKVRVWETPSCFADAEGL